MLTERMPISLAWVEDEVADLAGREQAIARLAIVLAKAPYQVSVSLVEPIVDGDEARFVRVLAWASFTAARRFIAPIAETARKQALAEVA